MYNDGSTDLLYAISNLVEVLTGGYLLFTILIIIVSIIIKWYFYMTIVRAGVEQGVQRVLRQMINMGIIQINGDIPEDFGN